MKTITIAGRLGKDAEVKTVGKDTVTEFTVAVDERVKVGQAWQKRAAWFRCQMWGQRGEKVAAYLRKGTSVAVAGEFSAREYQGKNGNATSLEIRVSELTLLGSKDDARQSNGGQAPADDFGGGDFGGTDDIPFDRIGRGIEQ
jgi:single-strand DNA-binding protein